MAHNPRDIKWPADTAGFLYRLKHEGVKAVERQHGNAGKHETLIATLELLLQHAKDRFEVQQSTRKAIYKDLKPKVKEPAFQGPPEPKKVAYK